MCVSPSDRILTYSESCLCERWAVSAWKDDETVLLTVSKITPPAQLLIEQLVTAEFESLPVSCSNARLGVSHVRGPLAARGTARR